jgi:hypothetical protein
MKHPRLTIGRVMLAIALLAVPLAFYAILTRNPAEGPPPPILIDPYPRPDLPTDPVVPAQPDEGDQP